ncbi:MAG TPA: alkaline phosphatase family protein [Rhodoblastus sp.]|nr:alkaline phosphatase family protein [Rhodoblastus sp.]
MGLSRRAAVVLLVSAPWTAAVAQTKAPAPQRNVLLFVADGLRAGSVRSDQTPNFAAVRDQGVNFVNSHSVFPTFTTANASAMATGHQLGDTGDFSNTIYTGVPIKVPGSTPTVTPFLESNPIMADVDEHFGGDYLNEETILKAAARKGFATAAIGKVGPAHIFDHTDNKGDRTITIDDQTGTDRGVPLQDWVKNGLIAMNGEQKDKTPGRGDNGKSGTKAANLAQQTWFVDAIEKVILPKFKADGKPFAIVYWSRDPDGSQHNQGDSPNAHAPGINGPTSLAGVQNADANLGRLRKALEDQGLAANTDIIVVADHGFSTISKESATSPATKEKYDGVPAGQLPPGFLAIDLAKGVGLSLFDPDQNNKKLEAGASGRGNGVIGETPDRPKAVVADNGGSDLVYFPKPIDRRVVRKTIAFLLAQDYVSGLFVDEQLGRYPGTLPTSAISLNGKAVTPHPGVVVNFRTFSAGCDVAEMCSVQVADTVLKQGQGMHGSLSRGDTHNFMAAIGPSFKQRFVDPAPASNADVGRTIASLLKLDIKAKGSLLGRVLSEAMPGGEVPDFGVRTIRSAPTKEGLRTIIRTQNVGRTKYLTTGGFPGRTVGLD